jgi:hypothetical protein
MDTDGFITTVTQIMAPFSDLYQQQKAVNTSVKPATSAVRQYEDAVYAFRNQRLPSAVKGVSQFLVDSIDAFEAGRVLEAGRSIMSALEHFEAAGKDSEVIITPEQSVILGTFRSNLFKMVVPSMELKQKRLDL